MKAVLQKKKSTRINNFSTPFFQKSGEATFFTANNPQTGNPLEGLKRGDGLDFGTWHLRPRVKLLQTRLNDKLNGDLEIDGMFGPLTGNALESFQTTIGVNTEEKVDAVSADELMNLNPFPKELPECPGLGDDIVLTSALEGEGQQDPSLPCQAGDKKKKEKVKIKPKNPNKPTDFLNYQCAKKVTIKIKIYTPSNSEKINTDILNTKVQLLNHNINLEVDKEPITARHFPMGFGINETGDHEGDIKTQADLCDVVKGTFKDVGAPGSNELPVFYLPLHEDGQVKNSLDEKIDGVHFNNINNTCGDFVDGDFPVNQVVLVDSKGSCHNVLIHEIGHAVKVLGGHSGIKENIMFPACVDTANTITHHQLKAFCNPNFK